ncbi:cytochrome bc1 complex cytochrome b subunit [Streptomyces fuscigenes]|uniref:cytochrome bc1 complex cytochrome b subunit n=1 Tax=Streptomyces fuscigenes TaxID=1528880 RepID=UPI001F2D50D8|nr:cytochrome bc complex cytochrome b subunit [Streptomyces fuscigenes]MCF3962706.1 ubiquinol-cytochrome c reductase cytochrome b subunit [Streptomyces fuscigenes]
MDEKDRPAGRESGGRGERVGDWIDARLGSASPAALRRRVFPDHWSFLLGEIVLYSFVVLLLTGVYLSLYFHPSAEQLRYHGSYAPLRGQLVSQAFDSTMHLSFDVRGGLLIRQMHHWAALVFVAAILAHLMRLFFTGAFRKPRELHWIIAFLLLVLGMFEGLTGYDLPDDLLSGTGLAVVHGTLLSVPVVGTYLAMWLFGGEFPGHELVARFNALHVVVLPALMVGLFAALALLSRRQRRPQFPGPGHGANRAVGRPLRVRATTSSGLFLMVVGILANIASIAQVNPIWQYGPYRPDQVSAGSQPDWYMGVADGLLRVMPGWEVVLGGHTLALDNLLPLLAGMVFFLALGAYPFVEAWVTRDNGAHRLLDRPRNRPVRTALGAAWLSVYAVALAGAANDVIATHFHVSVNAVTWAVRIGLFAVPAVVYSVAKRTALGLQLRDRDLVLHGRETGLIKRLPHGEYVEVHERLSPERLYALTAHKQEEPLVPAAPRGRDGARPHVTGTQRLRAGLSRHLYGEGTYIAEPTPTEHEEIEAHDE